MNVTVCTHPWSAVDEIGSPYCAGCGEPWEKVMEDDDLELGCWFTDFPEDRDFCLSHGYEYMKTDRGPIAYCAECERIALAGGDVQ